MHSYWRNGKGRPLVAIHGNFASKAWWRALVTHPPEGYEVFAPDLPGFADNKHHKPCHSIESFAHHLEQWMHKQGIEEAVLLGHSLGGAVAMELASRKPYPALILCAPPSPEGLFTPKEVYSVLELSSYNPALLSPFLARCFPSRLPHNYPEIVKDAARMLRSYYTSNAKALSRWSVDPESILCAVAVWGGSLDTLVSPESIAHTAQELHASSDIFAGMGHGFPSENPALFKHKLQEFLDTHV